MIHVIGTYLPRLLSHVISDPLWRMPVAQTGHPKTVYLTFDDGPTLEGTPRLLEILGRFEVQATFFLVGRHAQQHGELVRDLLDAGHTLGNHTYRHADAWRTPHAQICDELSRTTVILEELTGTRLRWMRPPFGHLTPRMLTWCKHAQQKLVMWDVLPGDFVLGSAPEKIAAWTQSHIRPGSIVCLHDNSKSRSITPPALEVLLPKLLDEGWHLAAL